MRLVKQEHEKDDPDPKAFACYGIDLRSQQSEEIWIRFVEGNPRSDHTIDFMKWTLEKTAGKVSEYYLCSGIMLLGTRAREFVHGFINTIRKSNGREKEQGFKLSSCQRKALGLTPLNRVGSMPKEK